MFFRYRDLFGGIALATLVHDEMVKSVGVHVSVSSKSLLSMLSTKLFFTVAASPVNIDHAT